MTRTTPINQTSPGDQVVARVAITDTRVAHWKYAADCDSVGGTFNPGSVFQVVEVSAAPGAMWIRIRMPGRNPPAFLKVAGGEYANAFENLGGLAGPTWRPDLTYNIVEARLYGVIDGQSIDVHAGSGGRAGSKVPGAANWRLQNNPLATHVGGDASEGTHAYGPVPAGRYVLEIHEGRANWIRLTPHGGNTMFERAGFAIHGRGQVGSHGCIVPADFMVIATLLRLLKARKDRGQPAPNLEVVAVGTDVDRKFRTV